MVKLVNQQLDYVEETHVIHNPLEYLDNSLKKNEKTQNSS